jgi:hypothetical protein
MPIRAALLAVLAAAPFAARAADVKAEPGVYWDQTVEMQMMGFSMPATTMRVCMPKGAWDQPPRAGDGDDNCQMTEVKRSGPRMTWKVKCKDGTSGSGDMTFGGDTFQGTTVMNTGGQTVKMAMKGKKVGGDCDANENQRRGEEVRQQIEDQQAQQAEVQAQGCAQAVAEMDVSAFHPVTPGAPPFCADKAKTTEFCKRLETREGLVTFRRNSGQEGAREQAETICKKRLSDVEKRLCAESAKEQSRGRKLQGDAVEFVFASCPDQAQAIAKTECAGRSYTGMPEAQREFCTRYARERLDQGDPPPAAAPAIPVPDVKRQILKGLFGR